jgi:hypothetical protein
MKRFFLFLACASYVLSFTTLYSADHTSEGELRSISRTLVGLIPEPSSSQRVEQHIMALPTSICGQLDHDTSKLRLVYNENGVEVFDTVQAVCIWKNPQHDLTNIVGAYWNETGEKVTIFCGYPGILTYRVSYESVLQQLTSSQLAFILTCNQHWTETKQPFVITEALYRQYQELPSELRHNSLFELTDAVRKQAQWDYCKSLAMLPIEAIRYLTYWCRTR